MAVKKLDFNIKVFDNFIEITPIEGMKDNSIYEIKLKGLKPLYPNAEAPDTTVKFATAMSPMHCNITDVASLLEVFTIPEDIILYNIREASKYAEYVFEHAHPYERFSRDKVPFEIKEFTRYRAAKDCLLKIYIALAADNVVSGQLGDVQYKLREEVPNLKELLKYLDDEIQKWLDAIKGYHIEGRARAQSAIRGYHHGGLNPRLATERRQTPKSVPLSIDRNVH